MDDIRQTAIDRFRAYLARRQFSAHTVASYTLDLRLFFAEIAVPLARVSFREVDQFVERQHQHGRAWATINRRLNALKHFFDFCLDQQLVRGNPVKPSHFVRRGHPLPKALCREQVQQLFAQIAHPMDRALFLVMLRCGLRVSEVAQLKLEQIDWEQQALHIMQGKGRKDRRVYMSPDAGGQSPPVPGAASGRPRAGLCLLEPQTQPAAPLGQSDPKEDGALRQSRRDHRELP